MTGGVWKLRKDKFKQWTNQKGFYTILFLCVVTVVGTSGVITTRNLRKLKNNQEIQEYVDLDAEFGDFDLLPVDDMGSGEGRLTVGPEEAAKTDVGMAESEEVENVAEVDEEKLLDFALEVPPNPEEQSVGQVAEADNLEIQETSTTAKVSGEEKLASNASEADNPPNSEANAVAKDSNPVANRDNQDVFLPYQSGDVMQWPVEGEVVMAFSTKKPVFDKTLEQFRTNSSISIAGPQTTQVRATASGIVESVTTNPQTGVTVVIDHGNGWKTTYGQLQDKVVVKENEVVAKGKVIGGIGKPSQYSVLLGEHLYFQVTKDGEPIDPSLVLVE